MERVGKVVDAVLQLEVVDGSSRFLDERRMVEARALRCGCIGDSFDELYSETVLQGLSHRLTLRSGPHTSAAVQPAKPNSASSASDIT